MTDKIWVPHPHPSLKSGKFDISPSPSHSKVSFRFLSLLWIHEIAEAIEHERLQKSGTMGRLKGAVAEESTEVRLPFIFIH